MTDNVITAFTVKRLISDIKDLKKNSLSKEGIYYKHDEKNMLLGYALIIGPENTPYAFGNFFFKINFPCDYPHSPPIVTYCTNDGFTRFNPNLYTNGKVCISILNTWRGDQWTGCLRIRSILLSLCSLLNKNPLTNEPGFKESHSDNNNYNKIIKFKTLEIAIKKTVITNEYLFEEFEIFKEEIKLNYIKNYKKILNLIDNEENKIIKTRTYNMIVKLNYEKLKNDLINFNEINNL